MRAPLFLIVADSREKSLALIVGGHNGATAVGVVVIILAIVFTIASSPSRSKK